jgi:predicted nucleotidyltransferase
MTNISLDLSNKLPTQTVEILKSINQIASELEIPILMIGATARDLVLHYAYNVRAMRATKDTDFAVMIENWTKYENLKSKLIESANFTPVKNIEHRLKENSTKTLIDIVPFGEIELPKGQITWQSEFQMTTFGFVEAFENALNVKLADNLVIKVVSPTGLAMLKLKSWTDRKENKDSQDFWSVAKNFLDLGNEDLLYSKYSELLENDLFDLKPIGARILGREIGLIIRPETKEIIATIFENEKTLFTFALEIHRFEGIVEDNLDIYLNSLNSFWLGVMETFQFK